MEQDVVLAGLTVDGDVASCAWDADQSNRVQARLCRQGEGGGQGLKLHPRGQQTLQTHKIHTHICETQL